MIRRCLAALLIVVSYTVAAKDYQLAAQKIAPDTYIFTGVNEDFSFKNGGNIVNTGFIITAQGVIVINTGPTRLYGQQMRAAIAAVTAQPIIKVYISKLHPDHFLGNQAFTDIPIATLAKTKVGIAQQGEMFTDNMYRMVGAWMRGTEMVVPTDIVTPGRYDFGDHKLELIALHGHTPADLVILDHTTGVLFAGGLVFHHRTPTTPHADLKIWLNALDQLQALDFKLLVPSHGPVSQNLSALKQTRSYLQWLDQAMYNAAMTGLDMAEVLLLDIPPKFKTLAVMPNEFQRSVSHLYNHYESQVLAKVPGGVD